MKMTHRCILSLVVLLIGLGVIAATPATKPASTATSKPAMGPDTSIARDQYHFPAPSTPEWSAVKPDPAAESIVFINQAHDGQIAIQLLPKDANVSDNVAVAVVNQLKKQYAESKTVMVMGPKIEHDKRFGIVVHERYKVGDQIADQLHIYKQIGPRVVMLLVNTTNGDADKVTAIQDAAREMLDEAKFNRKAFKKE